MIPFPWTIYSEEAAGGSSFRFGNVTGHCHLDGWLGRPLVSDQPSENSKRSLINCQEEVLLPPSLSICHFLLLLTFTNPTFINITLYLELFIITRRKMPPHKILAISTSSNMFPENTQGLNNSWVGLKHIGAFVKTLNHK